MMTILTDQIELNGCKTSTDSNPPTVLGRSVLVLQATDDSTDVCALIVL